MFFFVFLIAFGFAGYYGQFVSQNNQTLCLKTGIDVSDFISFTAQREGDLNRLLVPRDTDGLQCGQDSEVIGQKYLVFFDLSKCADPLVPLNGCPTPQTCVSECPSSDFVHDKPTCQQNLADYKKRLICTRKTDMNSIRSCDDIDRLIDAKHCAQWYLKSEPCKYIQC